jgi:hypothetical protein
MEPPVKIERRVTDGRKTKLFRVRNTALNQCDVLAVDSLVASAIAREAGRVRTVYNALSTPVDLAQLAGTRPKFAASIEHARQSGLQGIVTEKGGCAVVGNCVFTPEGEV